MRLQGHTNARFSNSFTTQNVVTTAATDCDGCAANQCIHVTGTLQSTFQVSTTVTLPQVAAFQTYIGIVFTPFDLTLCRNNFKTAIRALHNSLEASRQSVAQATSDVLDPFQFDVDLNCTD